MRSSISTRRRLEYAQGYLGLGMLKDAAAELDAIKGDERDALAVRRVRIDLAMEEKQWARVADLAGPVANALPKDEQVWISWAYALRELQRIEEAWDVLFKAERAHGHKSAILHYNLACYACLSGDFVEAGKRLKRAIKLDKRFEDEWPKDPDLQKLLDVF